MQYLSYFVDRGAVKHGPHERRLVTLNLCISTGIQTLAGAD